MFKLKILFILLFTNIASTSAMAGALTVKNLSSQYYDENKLLKLTGKCNDMDVVWRSLEDENSFGILIRFSGFKTWDKTKKTVKQCLNGKDNYLTISFAVKENRLSTYNFDKIVMYYLDERGNRVDFPKSDFVGQKAKSGYYSVRTHPVSPVSCQELGGKVFIMDNIYVNGKKVAPVKIGLSY